ncbi:ADP-ribosylglycohydrolase family protein [Streptomyces sp. NPDC051677]|uniref:ADP-ribosylglycohydrolase family protein n=1 Tax=Streptomyces sp. NPDC051677 TaxID=3365669 RepID=UPI0037CF8578
MPERRPCYACSKADAAVGSPPSSGNGCARCRKSTSWTRSTRRPAGRPSRTLFSTSAPSGRRGTNGAAMRVLPVGWAVPVSRPDLRRRHAVALARATHTDEESIAAACVMAALSAWSVESVRLDAVLDAGREEAEWALGQFTGAAGVREFLDALDGRWRPPVEGIGLAAGETIAAVAHVLAEAAAGETLSDALLRAVLLGGDTDTVAALAGGILGGQAPEAATDLP